MVKGWNFTMRDTMSPSERQCTFGEFIKKRRESLGKSLRELALELNMTPAYLSDIEKGNRYAPEKYLHRFVELLYITGEDIDFFYELAGKSRNNVYPDLNEYIANNSIARVALRRARDYNITESQWQQFIDMICSNKERRS